MGSLEPEGAIMSDLYGRIILVAEEEYFITDEVTQALEKAGADVLGPVGTLGGALTLLKVMDRVDGAVLDINLRDEEVYPVIDMLEARGIPYVFATSDGETAIPDKYKHVARWTKPFRMEDLATGFRDLLRR
jgi:DNA-binding response OmpR family regulator